MKLSEAIAAMEQGKKVKRRGWHESRFIYLDSVTQQIRDEEELKYILNVHHFYDEWELYEEPIPENAVCWGGTDFEYLRKEFVKLSDKHDLLQKQIWETNRLVSRLGKMYFHHKETE